MNTLHRYVKGEEYLGDWMPRGVSLVRDFLRAKRRRIRVAEVENAKGFLSSLPVTRNATPTTLKPRLEEALQESSSQDPERPIQEDEEGEAAESGVMENAEVSQVPPPSGDGEDENGARECSAGKGMVPKEDPQAHVLRRYVELWSLWKDPSEVCR
jgi:kinesin family protein 1